MTAANPYPFRPCPHRQLLMLSLALVCWVVAGLPRTAWATPVEAPASQPATSQPASASQATSQPTSQPSATPRVPALAGPTSQPAARLDPAAQQDPAPSAVAEAAVDRVPYGYSPENGLPEPSAKLGTQRPKPRYDGTAPRLRSLGDGLVWLPRVLLFPVYLTTEYLLRKPIVGLITLAEKVYLLEWLKWLFVWNDDDVGIIPTVFVDFGLKPSVGLFFFYKDLFGRDQLSTVQAAFWGNQWVNLQLAQRFGFFEDESAFLELRGGYLTRPDQPFYGIGARTDQSDELFFRPLIGQAEIMFSGEIHKLNRFTTLLRFRNADFDGGQSPSVDQLLSAAEREQELSDVIPGFSEYNLLTLHMQVDLDTRSVDPLLTAGSGARLELFGSFNIDPAEPALNFFTWGYEAGLFWDFSGYNHVLGVRLYMAFLETTGDNTVPFYELPSLGGNELMRGFFDRRFLGESVVDATIAYRYPVWAILDGTVFLGLGNAFDDHLRDFAIDRLFLNWGFGLRSSTDRYTSFEILLAFGSNRIDSDDFDPVAALRFVFGVNSGF